MNRDRHNMPRHISPELVEIGDDIEVHHKADRGVKTILRGMVGKRVDSGQTRYYLTEEGATLMAWAPDTTKIVRVILHSRAIKPQETLFEAEILEETKQRIA